MKPIPILHSFRKYKNNLKEESCAKYLTDLLRYILHIINSARNDLGK
jgi:hypothetical protein